MSKIIIFLILFLLKFTNLSAEVVKSIVVSGNQRISSETIIIFSKVNIDDDIKKYRLNSIIKDLYSTDFFENVFSKDPQVQKSGLNTVPVYLYKSFKHNASNFSSKTNATASLNNSSLTY